MKVWATGLALVTAAAVPLEQALAAQWEVTPRIGLRETYTDNVDLEPDDEADSDLITELRPGITVTGEGRRFDANLNYTLQALYYAEDSDQNEAFHQLNAGGEVELLRETFFIEGSARRRQSAGDLLGPQGDNVVGGDREENTGVEVSPYLVNRWGSFAESELRYRHSRTRTEPADGGPADDSYSNTGSLRLDSGPAFQRLRWSLGGRYERIRSDDGGEGEFADSDDGTFRSADALLGWQVGRTLELSVTGGYEDNDYQTTRDEDDLSDTFWDAGFTWRPNRRTSLEARYGERFFGDTTTFSATYRARALTFNASRVETISSERDQVFLDPEFFAIRDPDTGEIIRDPDTGQPRIFVDPNARVVNEFFIDTRTTGSITYTGRRLTVTLSGFQRDRELEASERTEEEIGGGLGASWQLGAQSSLTFGSRYSRNTVEPEGREDDIYNVSFTFNRRFGESLNTFATVRRQERTSNDDAAEYTENAVIVGLDQRF